jgi:hypothetical protein
MRRDLVDRRGLRPIVDHRYLRTGP